MKYEPDDDDPRLIWLTFAETSAHHFVLLKWIRKPGDFVIANEDLCLFLFKGCGGTDGEFAYRCPADGDLRHMLPEGATVLINQRFASVRTGRPDWSMERVKHW